MYAVKSLMCGKWCEMASKCSQPCHARLIAVQPVSWLGCFHSQLCIEDVVLWVNVELKSAAALRLALGWGSSSCFIYHFLLTTVSYNQAGAGSRHLVYLGSLKLHWLCFFNIEFTLPTRTKATNHHYSILESESVCIIINPSCVPSFTRWLARLPLDIQSWSHRSAPRCGCMSVKPLPYKSGKKFGPHEVRLEHFAISEWISGPVTPPNEGSLGVQHVTVGTGRPEPSTFN